MISIIVAGAFISYILYRYLSGKECMTPLVLYSLISPYIQIGGSKYDSLYFACIIFFAAVVFKSKGRLRWKRKSWVNRYFLVHAALIALYLGAWLLFSRTDFGTTLTTFLGVIKLALIVFFAYYMNQGITRERMTDSIVTALRILTILNMAACLIQLSSKSLGVMIVKTFGSEETTSFLAAVTQWGFFSRCFGLMETPMGLGIIMLFSAAFFFVCPSKRRIKDYIYLVLTVFCGAFSASKTFWLGFGVLMVMSIFCERRTVKGYAIRGLIVAAFVLVILAYDQIGSLISKYLGGTYYYYWKFLSNPLEAFATRYSSESVFLGFMPSFLEKYWLLGVGPSSIAGERAIDSAFANLLHDGGVTGLLLIVGFYAVLLKKSIRNKTSLVLIALLFVTGFGFQTWISSRVTLFVMIYLLMSLDLKTKPIALPRAGADADQTADMNTDVLPQEAPLPTL